MDVDSAIVISDSDTEENESANPCEVCPFIPTLTKRPEGTTHAVPRTSNFQTVTIVNKSTHNTKISAETGKRVKNDQTNAPLKKIAVKSFAAEKNIKEKAGHSLIYVNKKPVKPGTNSFVNIANAQANTIQLSSYDPLSSKVTSGVVKQASNTNVGKHLKLSDKLRILKSKPMVVEYPSSDGTEFATPESNVPIKLVDINSILRKELADAPQAQTVAEVKNAKLPTQVSNETQKLSAGAIVPSGTTNKHTQLSLTAQTNGSSSTKQIFIRKSDLRLQHQSRKQISDPLSAILSSLPGLRNAQNIYLINVPNHMQLALNSLSQKPVLVQQPSTSRAMHVQPKVPETPATTTGNCDNSEHTPDNPPKEKPKRLVVAHRCLELRKNGFKIDIEGYTYFDRLGFFKAEMVRAKRCMNILNLHIKVREQMLCRLLPKPIKEQKELPLKNRMEKLVEKCKTENPTKINSSTSTKRKRLLKNKCVVAQTKKRSSTKFKSIQRKIDIYSKYNLKPLKVVLSRDAIEQYLKQKKENCKWAAEDKPRCEVSKWRIPLFYKTYTLTELFLSKTDTPITFIDDNYFELLEQLGSSENCLYYVNKHNLVTALFMDYFPQFKKAVQSHKVRIVNKADFERYLSSSEGQPRPAVKTFCSTSENVESKPKNVSKKAEFCNFVNDFHSLQKKSQLHSKVIKSEHNYCIKNKA